MKCLGEPEQLLWGAAVRRIISAYCLALAGIQTDDTEFLLRKIAVTISILFAAIYSTSVILGNVVTQKLRADKCAVLARVVVSYRSKLRDILPRFTQPSVDLVKLLLHHRGRGFGVAKSHIAEHTGKVNLRQTVR